MGRSLRLFVAAYPPLAAAQRWLEEASTVLPSDVRLTDAPQIHLTLVFLGEQDERSLPEIRESVDRSVHGFGPIALSPGELTTLPMRGAPRLLVMTTDLPPALKEVQRRLAQRLALDPAPRSVFLPHFTLARFPGRSLDRVRHPLDELPFEISETRLMRSRLLPEGAVHQIDKVFPLQPS